MVKVPKRRQPTTRGRAKTTTKVPRSRKPSKSPSAKPKQAAPAPVQAPGDRRDSELNNPVQAMQTTHQASTPIVRRDFYTMKIIHEVGDIVLPHAPASTGDWRQSLTAEKRIQVCKYLYNRFSVLYPGVIGDHLRKMTSDFEKRQFVDATGLDDYIDHVADGLALVENSVKDHLEELQAVANSAAGPSKQAQAGHSQTSDVNTSVTPAAPGSGAQAGQSSHGSSYVPNDTVLTNSESSNSAGQPSFTSTGWRASLTPIDRIKVCQFIMDRLSAYCPSASLQEVRDKTSAFEFKIYQVAESRTAYLKTVYKALTGSDPPTKNTAKGASDNAGVPREHQKKAKIEPKQAQ